MTEETSAPTFRQWLRARRKTLDLTQEALATRAGCSVVTVRRIEEGALRPSRQLAELLAAGLEIPLAERPAFVQWARAGNGQGAAPPPPPRAASPAPALPPPPAGPVPEPTNPYKGLRAFQEADAPDFFGRAALAERLVARLAAPGPGFLAVVGPSGSGKSSVVRAGLVPALRQGAMPPVVANLVPGAQPWEELEAALLRVAVNPPASLREQLLADERGLLRAVKRVLPDDPAAWLLLVIDQFEEVFTLVADEALRADFLDSLAVAVAEPRSPLRVVVTLRADFYDRPLVYASYARLLGERTEVVGPLAPAELHEAIAGPAARAGLALEPGLAPTIIQDVGEQPGTLPLLQYALTELFERRAGRQLTLAAYRASGGVLGALGRRAEAIYSGLPAPEQETARQLFLRLVTLGEGTEDTRRRAHLAELTSLAPGVGGGELGVGDEGGGGWGVGGGVSNQQLSRSDPRPPVSERSARTDIDTDNPQSAIRHPQLPTPNPQPPTPLMAVLEAFGRYRLLTFDRDPVGGGPTVEVAHEALLRAWDRLRGWLDASREDLRVQRRLLAAATEWAQAGQDGSFLAGGARLAQFEALAAGHDVALTTEETAYLRASVAERDRQQAAEQARQERELVLAQREAAASRSAAQRLRGLVGGLALFLLVAAGLAAFALRSRGEAVTSFTRSEAQRLAAEANTLLAQGGNAELIALLSIRSMTTQYSPQGDAALEGAQDLPYPRQVYAGHGNWVSAVAFAPDGRSVLTGSWDGTARLWDRQSGALLHTFGGHRDKVSSVAFAPDGRRVLTGSYDNTARLWDTASGAPVITFTGHTGAVFGVAFAPDGRTALTGSLDRTARLWSVQSGREIQRFTGHDGGVLSVALAPDGQTVLTSSEDKTARLWDVATGQELRRFTGHTGAVYTVAFLPDGRQVVTGGADLTVRIWDTPTGAEARRYTGYPAPVESVAVAPDGRSLLVGGDDNVAQVWDAQAPSGPGVVLHRLAGHSSFLRGVAVAPDGRSALTASADGTARLWDLQAPTAPPRFTPGALIAAVAVAPDGRTAVTGGTDRQARLWDTASGAAIITFTGHTGDINGVAFAPDGRTVLTGSFDHTARLWDVQTGREVQRFLGHTDAINGVAFAPDGQTVLTGGGNTDPTARLWNVATGREIRRFVGHAGWVYGVTFAPDGQTLLTAGGDGTARLWDVATGREIRRFTGHSAALTGVAFAPDGRTILTGSLDATARLWDVATGREIRRFTGHIGPVWSVAFAPDGRTVLTGSADKTARLWDVATGAEIRRFAGHTAGVEGVAFLPGGRLALTGSEDGTARLWPVAAADLIHTLCGRLLRDFSPAERAQYNIPDANPTCPQP